MSSRVITVADVIKGKRFFRGGLFGEPDSGKSATSGTLSPGRGTCVIVTTPESQMITRDPAERLFVPTNFAETCLALKMPEKFFGNDIQTLVWDDATITINRGLADKSVATAKEGRLIYKEVQYELEGALLHTISKPFHFVIIAQARKMMNDITGETEITFDVPPSMENTLVAYVDYAFFVNKPPKLGEPPTLQLVPVRRMISKVKLTRQQWQHPPITAQEPADLAALWNKLNGGTK